MYFFDLNDMPGGAHTDFCIPFENTLWLATKDLKDKNARNLCGAAAAANLAAYFINCGYSALKAGSIEQTYREVHSIVGNGPKMTIARGAVKYFAKCGHDLHFKTDRSISKKSRINFVKNAVSLGRPCGILLADKLFSWHWVLAVGYREYTDGVYLRIVDGWSNNASRFYKPGYGSVWISTTEYWI